MYNTKEIIDLIKSTPAVLPPDDFTARVMKAIMKEEGLFERAWRVLSAPRVPPLDPVRALLAGSGQDELGAYFLLVAFAHLSLGVVLLTGFSRIDTVTPLPDLFGMQPWFSFLLALWLGIWGGLLKRGAKTKRRGGARGARFAALVYIEVVVINGVLLFMEFNRLFFLVPFIAAIVGSAIAAGIFLAFISGSNNTGTKRQSPAVT